MRKRLFISSDEEKALWSTDFRKMIGGSIVSYAGNNAMSFILGFYVLDVSGSVLLFALYLFLYSLSRVAVPILAGPFLDRIHRMRVIYLLDFCSAALFFGIWLRIGSGTLSYFELYLITFLIGTIDSIYKVATGSVFPLLVENDQLSKAYSILATIEIMSLLAIPVAMVLYKSPYSKLVFLFGALLFAAAAVIETTIRVKEDHVEKHGNEGFTKSQFFQDTKEGIAFLRDNRPYLYVVISIFFYSFLFGALLAVELPFFQRLSPEKGYIYYIIVYGVGMAGRFLCNAFLYLHPVKKRFWFALAVIGVLLFSAADAAFLFTPLAAMIVLQLVSGILIGFYHNFRKTTIQAKLDDERRARYCGMELMADNLGTLFGSLVAGILEQWMSIPMVVLVAAALNGLSFAVMFLGWGRQSMKALFNE